MLQCRNNWEYIEWIWKGNKIDVREVSKVKLDTVWYDITVKERRSTYNDMGKTDYAKSLCIYIPIDFHGVVIHAGLYETKLYQHVKDIDFVDRKPPEHLADLGL